jgi:hypothetical protein
MGHPNQYTRHLPIFAPAERANLPEARAVKALRRAAEIWHETALPISDHARAEWHAVDAQISAALLLARDLLRTRDRRAYEEYTATEAARKKTEFSTTLKEGEA